MKHQLTERLSVNLDFQILNWLFGFAIDRWGDPLEDELFNFTSFVIRVGPLSAQFLFEPNRPQQLRYAAEVEARSAKLDREIAAMKTR